MNDPSSPTWAPTAVGGPPLSRAPLEATPHPFRTDILGYDHNHVLFFGVDPNERFYVRAHCTSLVKGFDRIEQGLVVRVQFETAERGQVVETETLPELGLTVERAVAITLHLPARVNSLTAEPQLIRVGAENARHLLPGLRELEQALLAEGTTSLTPFALSHQGDSWVHIPMP